MTPKCFHCDLDIPKDSNFNLIIFGQTREFCCPGCLAVAQMIKDSGQLDFYRFRTQSNVKAEE